MNLPVLPRSLSLMQWHLETLLPMLQRCVILYKSHAVIAAICPKVKIDPEEMSLFN